MAEQKLSPRELIQKRKMEAMHSSAGNVDWEEIENNAITQWYCVSKVMHQIIPRTFPYFTFKGIVEEISKDPNFKQEEDEK